MNFNDDNEFIPSLQLLPFGGFEVAKLLQKLQTNDSGASDARESVIEFQGGNGHVSSGWLRSKMMAG